jgi:regulatory LuxR family protein
MAEDQGQVEFGATLPQPSAGHLRAEHEFSSWSGRAGRPESCRAGVSVRTVNTHWEHLFRKLGVTHRTQGTTDRGVEVAPIARPMDIDDFLDALRSALDIQGDASSRLPPREKLSLCVQGWP